MIFFGKLEALLTSYLMAVTFNTGKVSCVRG